LQAKQEIQVLEEQQNESARNRFEDRTTGAGPGMDRITVG
jgi:hypothetical protein